MSRVRCLWTVTAGLIPGQTDEKHTRHIQITSEEWESSTDTAALFLSRQQQAVTYATQLGLYSMSGREPNWVRIEYCWI